MAPTRVTRAYAACPASCDADGDLPTIDRDACAEAEVCNPLGVWVLQHRPLPLPTGSWGFRRIIDAGAVTGGGPSLEMPDLTDMEWMSPYDRTNYGDQLAVVGGCGGMHQVEFTW